MGWFRNLFSHRRRYDELSETIREHLDEKIADLMDRGMTREQAERAARREFGNVTLVEERSREVWQWAFLEHLRADLRFAWRQAAKSPRFVLAAVGTLAIGISAQTTIYSVVHAVLIDPYPYRDSMRMVHLHLYDKDPFPDDLSLTGPQFAEFEKSPVLDGAVAQDMFSRALTGEELPEQVQASYLSPNGFEYFGVPALLGREFGPSDGANVAVLSYHFWKSHYAGRTNVLGEIVQIDHENYTIIGVLPQRFVWIGSDLYTPLRYSTDPHRIANVFARIKEGISDRTAEQALQPTLDRFAQETPSFFPKDFKVHLVHINEIAIGRFRGVLVILFVSVSFLLLLACVNVAILLLSRGEVRQFEIALRKTLGAGPKRIIAQLLTESLLLSAAGGCFGVLLALGGIRLVRHFLVPLPALFPPEADIRLNLPVLFFSVGVSMATGILCGLWPALRIARTELRPVTDAGSHKLAGSKGTRRGHTILLAWQVAITILLLASSGATLQRLSQLIHADLGYDPHQLISVNIALREGDHHGWTDRIQYYEQIRKTIASDPEVVSAAITEDNLPPSIIDSSPISIPGIKANGQVNPQKVSLEYFATLRIPFLRGRIWSAPEIMHAAHFVIINEALQRQYWPNTDPIGQTIILNNGAVPSNVWTQVAPGVDQRFQVIGVVGNTPNRGLDEQVAPSVYVPYTAIAFDWFNLVLRTRGNPAGLLRRVKEQVHLIDSGQAVGDVVTATDLLESNGLGREQFIAVLFSAFAFLALAFAVSGLYCVQSYLVAQRTREFGVRIALGARKLNIVKVVTASSFFAVLTGTIIGVLVDLGLSPVLAVWTQGNSRDPEMLAVVILILLVTAGLASVIPAHKAASIDPIQALRSE